MGGIKFVGSVCEPSEGENSSRMRAEIIWRLAELWCDDIERYDAYCYEQRDTKTRQRGASEPKKRGGVKICKYC